MSSIAESMQKRGSGWWFAVAGFATLIVMAGGIFQRSRLALDQAYGQPTREMVEHYQMEQGRDKIRGAGFVSSPRVMAELTPGKARVDPTADRKLIRNSTMEMVVKNPSQAAESIRALAEGMGGFLVSSEVNGGHGATTGSLTIRVPEARFEEARAEIRKVGLNVESEKVEAQDVTRRYVDQDASLRNLHAEEAQYLSILKGARSVKEMLEVTNKLSEVRGEIEQQQAEFDALSKQVETVAITISLRAETDAQVFGVHWRPLYQMKLALRDGLDAVGDYAAAMISILFYLPAVLLWVGTVLLVAAAAWKVLRWVARVFSSRTKASVVQGA